jgi:predicted RNase H-like HicB family nuclease
MPNYRVQVQFDAAKNVFLARAPELPQSSAEGATRAEAVARLEEEIAAQVATIADQGGNPPRAVDEMPVVSASPDEPPSFSSSASGQLDGRISARVSPSLHRELLFHARVEGLPLDVLVGELLSESLAIRGIRDLRMPRGPRHPDDQPRADAGRPPRRDDRGGGPGPGGGGGRGRDRAYSDIMESSASFLEYVRAQEQGQGRPGGGGGGGGGRGGGGRGGGGRSGGR